MQGGVDGDHYGMAQPDDDSDRGPGDEANPLIVPINEEGEKTQEEIMKSWFSQDVFAKAVEEGDLAKDDSDEDMEADVQQLKISLQKKASKSSHHISSTLIPKSKSHQR